jgi:hypothetical protein
MEKQTKNKVRFIDFFLDTDGKASMNRFGYFVILMFVVITTPLIILLMENITVYLLVFYFSSLMGVATGGKVWQKFAEKK